MLKLDRDIRSLSDFKRKTPEFVKLLEATGEPVVLTMNGRAKVVVQDAQSYQKMVDVVERAKDIDAIRAGLESVDAGRTMSLEHFDRMIREKNNLPKRK